MKCPFHSLHTLRGWQKQPNADVIDGVKVWVSDSTSWLLSEDTLKSIASEWFSLYDLMPFINELRNLLDNDKRDEIGPRIEDYLSQEGILKKLVYLKMDLNNLHIQMFWEYFQEELRKLWKHDFFAWEDGKMVNLPLEHLTDPIFVAKELTKRREKWKSLQSILYLTWAVGMKYFLQDNVLKSLDAHFHTNSLWNKNVIGFSDSLLLIQLSQNEVFSELYKDFVEKNKENEIVRGYIFLEHVLLSKTWIKSDFNTVFPNTNYEFIKDYLLRKNYYGEKFSLSEFSEFLKCQNRENIKRALLSWNISAHVHNLYWLEFFVFDEQKNAYVLDLTKVPDEITKEVADSIWDSFVIKWTHNGACPYSMTKTLDGKNAFLELFSFFDQYYLKLVEHYLKKIS